MGAGVLSAPMIMRLSVSINQSIMKVRYNMYNQMKANAVYNAIEKSVTKSYKRRVIHYDMVKTHESARECVSDASYLGFSIKDAYNDYRACLIWD